MRRNSKLLYVDLITSFRRYSYLLLYSTLLRHQQKRTGLKQQSQISKQMSDCSHNALTFVGHIRSKPEDGPSMNARQEGLQNLKSV